MLTCVAGVKGGGGGAVKGVRKKRRSEKRIGDWEEKGGNAFYNNLVDTAEQHLRMCIDGRGLRSKPESFAKGFPKHSCILAIFRVDSGVLLNRVTQKRVTE